MRVAMHRLCFNFNVVETGDWDALKEIFDVGVTTLAGIGIGLLVEIEEAEVEDVSVCTLKFLVLDEVTVKTPLLRLQHGFPEAGFHQAIRRLKVLIHEETGRHEGSADGVDMLTRFFFRKICGQPERVHTSTK